jgi:two-component system cell cycle sensor histidine kinase/response regulator CckA
LPDTAKNDSPASPEPAETAGVPADFDRQSMHALAGGVAHAFNNLLASSIGHMELAIAALPAGSPVRDDLEYALADGRKMTELCHRTISRCGTGMFNMSRLDLRKVAKSAAAQLAAEVPKKARLRVNPGSWPVWVSGDYKLLEALTVNLIRNALEAMRPDGGLVTVSPLILMVDDTFLAAHSMRNSLKLGEHACIEVSDNGYGMDAVISSRAAMPLFSTKGAGRGLGLTEVHGIVLIHGGVLAIESEVGKGSTFTVLLPPYADRSIVHPAPEPPVATQRGKVLIIDDEPGVRRYASRILQRMGLETFTAADGFEGLDRFREHADEIDLVLLDVIMPRMDGDVVLKELRQIRPGVKILLVSGYQDAALSDRFGKQEIANMLFKPFSTADFISRVERAMQGTKK